MTTNANDNIKNEAIKRTQAVFDNLDDSGKELFVRYLKINCNLFNDAGRNLKLSSEMNAADDMKFFELVLGEIMLQTSHHTNK